MPIYSCYINTILCWKIIAVFTEPAITVTKSSLKFSHPL